MSTLSPALRELIQTLRHHPGLTELLKAIPAPSSPRYKVSRSGADNLEVAGAKHAYYSGRADEYDRWFTFLTGQPPNEIPHSADDGTE